MVKDLVDDLNASAGFKGSVSLKLTWRDHSEALLYLYGVPEWSIDAELVYMNWREI